VEWQGWKTVDRVVSVLSVCLSVFLPTYLRNSWPNFIHFVLCMLTVGVAQSSSVSIVIRNVCSCFVDDVMLSRSSRDVYLFLSDKWIACQSWNYCIDSNQSLFNKYSLRVVHWGQSLLFTNVLLTVCLCGRLGCQWDVNWCASTPAGCCSLLLLLLFSCSGFRSLPSRLLCFVAVCLGQC